MTATVDKAVTATVDKAMKCFAEWAMNHPFKIARESKSAADHESILQEAQRLIFGDRREEYGHPLDDYTRTAGMVNACFAHILKRPFTPEECMTFMILVKVSRYQETAKRDTLVDMAGYCGTIGEAQAERARRQLVQDQKGSEK